jgi:hypothetical protein
MDYSKSNSPAIPKNYGGNAFRVIDESDRTYHTLDKDEGDLLRSAHLESDGVAEGTKCNEKKTEPNAPVISSFLSGISVEDVLLLGLIFVIHEENPNDPVLFLLLLLLLSK